MDDILAFSVLSLSGTHRDKIIRAVQAVKSAIPPPYTYALTTSPCVVGQFQSPGVKFSDFFYVYLIFHLSHTSFLFLSSDEGFSPIRCSDHIRCRSFLDS